MPLRLAILAAACVATAEAAAPRASLDQRHAPLLAAHCRRCHGPDTQESGVRVDDLPPQIDSIAAAERWQKVLNVLNSGEMPPETEPRIDPAAKTEFLDDLSETLAVARKSLADQGGVIAMRRLNRREYHNTIRDLLGVDVNVSELPADTGPLAFDTVGAGLFMTAGQFELYEGIAREAVALAVARWSASDRRLTWRLEVESTLPKFVANHELFRERLRRSEEWFRAFEAAKARPDNAAVLAELRAATPEERRLMYSWDRFAGMPPPEAFGFVGGPAFNPAALARIIDERRFVPYERHYLALPALDTGGYLTMASAGAGPNTNSVLQFEIPLDWPPGECVARIRCAAAAAAPARRRYLEFATWSMNGPLPPRSVHQVTASIDAPQEFVMPFSIGAPGTERMNRRIYLFRERGTGDARYVSSLFREEFLRNGHGPEPAIWVDAIEIERLPDPPGDRPPGVRALADIGLLGGGTPPVADAVREGVRRFCAEAYRGEGVTDAALDRLLAIARSRSTLGGSHRDAMTDLLVAVLSSPRFLYRPEPAPDGSRRALDPLELATRLSYFLQGGPPDATLRGLAAGGRLLEPAVLASQTDRLLDDPGSRGFIEPFLAQWLSMERLDFFQVDPLQFPRFDRAVKESARREVFETFGLMLRENGSIRDLLMADHVVVDGLLADYYGLDGVRGDAFRRVSLPAGSPRGGLLGMAAIHVMGSNGEQSSPVERGAWVLRKLLNDPPPPAPPNVPQLARLAGRSLTSRERTLLHQEEPQCANCHRKIDPIGFGLENFDAVGQWRTTDTFIPVDEAGKKLGQLRKTWTIDPSGRLHGGPAFADFFELRDLIASRSDAFARGFTAALVEYALGRPCGFSDEPLVEEIVSAAGRHDLQVRSFIHALVQSDAFRSK